MFLHIFVFREKEKNPKSWKNQTFFPTRFHGSFQLAQVEGDEGGMES
jgi:hypothetical protein